VRISALLVAIVAFAGFVALGLLVGRHPDPPALFAWERTLVDHSTLVAWWLTWDVYKELLFPLAFVLLVVAWRVPSWRTRIFFSVILLLLCWQGADLFQHLFARPRRFDWVVKHETSFSYPSSHAAIATGFYGLWAVMLYASELPRPTRTIGAFLLFSLAVATCWSRLALGAHYLTDLIGGALLAVALVCAGLAVVPSVLTFPLAGRLSRAAE
jgi:membrane-associated phospholipid phosphatase